MSSDHDASIRHKILRTYSRKNLPTPPANPSVASPTEKIDGIQSYTTHAWELRLARDPSAKIVRIPRSMTDSAVSRDPRVASLLEQRDLHLPTNVAPSLGETPRTREGHERRPDVALPGVSSKPEQQPSTTAELPEDTAPKLSSDSEESVNIPPFVKTEGTQPPSVVYNGTQTLSADEDFDMFPTAAEVTGRFQTASHLHPNISLEDFKDQSVPAVYSNPISPTAQHLGLQPRDGFSNMEGVELTKFASSKRRRREPTIPGMGQLTCVTGFKESPKRRKCRRQMPIIDPDLLPAPAPADNVDERRTHSQTPSQSNADSSTERIGSLVTSYESRQPEILGVLPSVEFPEIPATPLSALRKSQPLMFDKQFEDSLAFGRVTLQSPTNHSADLLSEQRPRLHGGAPKATSWSGPRDNEIPPGSSGVNNIEPGGLSAETGLSLDRSTPKTCDGWLAG